MPGNSRRSKSRIAELARRAGFRQISTGHAVSPLLGLVPRAQTTLADAYLSPVLRAYVDRLSASLAGTRLYLMQSNGGLTEAALFQGRDSVLSGPAGGIVGAARTAEAAVHPHHRLRHGGYLDRCFALCRPFERSFDTGIAGIELRAPMMAIHTVAAGGGSILAF